MKDETIECVDCHEQFTFTVAEQEFYASKGFENKPKRCQACRNIKKNAARGGRPNNNYNSSSSSSSRY